jgi:hypothetical protein
MAKIKDNYRILLGRDFKRYHIAATDEVAETITLERSVDTKAVFDNTVVAIGEWDLVRLIGDKDVSDISGGQLTVSGIDYWQFELLQGSTVGIKSASLELGGSVTFKVSANEDGTLVVRGIASASPARTGKK